MLTTITLNRTEQLDVDKHNRAGFSCGVKELDKFLQQKARKESPSLSLTFVATCAEDPAQILGYFSLSATNLRADDLPDDIRKKFGQYGVVPATLLGRLAVAENYQRSKDLRLGEFLLIDAMFRTWNAAQSVASFGMLVRILKGDKGDPTPFYDRFGFIRCAQTADSVYLPMKTSEGILQESGLIP